MGRVSRVPLAGFAFQTRRLVEQVKTPMTANCHPAAIKGRHMLPRRLRINRFHGYPTTRPRVHEPLDGHCVQRPWAELESGRDARDQ